MTKFRIKTILTLERWYYLKIFIVVIQFSIYGQSLEYRIHDRGMLHETVYNSGDIGRPWTYGTAGNYTNTPVMEWPSRSETIVNGTTYSGQHNILGAGMYMAANIEGRPGKPNRLYSLCGGVGTESGSEPIIGQWSFPYFINEIENFPVADNGDLNPAYDPDEAEEIIVAKWASSLGVTVKRTSRAWSYPDYDDMIIYEYELEYTGDTDGDSTTIEQDSMLVDFMALFIYGFAPSMYGYQRHYGEWKYAGGIYRGDQNNSWDYEYWLSFNLNLRTNITDDNLFAKPIPNNNEFQFSATTGLNGGGLCSPQAPGFCVLYYDTSHLAIVNPYDSTLNESEVVNILRTFNNEFFEIDSNYHLKQPYSNKVSTGNTRSSKMKVESINPDKRWSGVYSPNSTTWPNPPSSEWIGRAAYNYRSSADAGQKHIVFGPYTLHHGDKLEFSLAEVVGYGAEAGKIIEGGQYLVQWAATPSWNRRIVFQGDTLTHHYIDDYGYPDYVNSDIINVTQVAHQAFKTYLGAEPSLPVDPELHPKHGNYQIPVPVPAPAINVELTANWNVEITWNRSVESFSHPRLTGNLEKFYICRSDAGMGPWALLDSINVGDVNNNDMYEYTDTDSTFWIGQTKYYAVVSVDDNGNQSGKTNITEFFKTMSSINENKDKYAQEIILFNNYPNPFNPSTNISYYMPRSDKIKLSVFDIKGELVEILYSRYQSPGLHKINWVPKDISSGVYFIRIALENKSLIKKMMYIR